MPYDYYEILKQLRDNDEYTEVSDIVRQKIWNETIDFKIFENWIKNRNN